MFFACIIRNGPALFCRTADDSNVTFDAKKNQMRRSGTTLRNKKDRHQLLRASKKANANNLEITDGEK